MSFKLRLTSTYSGRIMLRSWHGNDTKPYPKRLFYTYLYQKKDIDLKLMNGIIKKNSFCSSWETEKKMNGHMEQQIVKHFEQWYKSSEIYST